MLHTLHLLNTMRTLRFKLADPRNVTLSVCKFADVNHVAPRFYWWTTLFHAAVAYSMCLCGMQLRGVNAAEDYLVHLY